MLQYYDYTQFFIAMLAIVDPITILPIYVHLLRKFDPAEQAQLARKVAGTTTIALVITVFIGQRVLDFFGISIGSFQIAGGILLLVVALQLMYQTDPMLSAENKDKSLLASEAVVPLAIPLLAGPGAFSTVIVFSFRSPDWQHGAVLSGCLLILGGIVWASLHMANKLMTFLSPVTISVTNKIMGLILAAISIEFVANGIKRLFL